LFKQYYQYGLYKPIVLKKIRSGFSIRHLIPATFVIYLLSIPFFAMVNLTYTFIPLAIYMLFNLAFAFASKKGFMQSLRIAYAYFLLHFSYGLGFLIGLEKISFGKR